MKICRNPFGLMFRNLKKGDSIVLKASYEGILSSAIHTLFVFYPIDVIWLDSNKLVVDKKTVNPFVLYSRPRKPAKYIVEMRKGFAKNIKIGEKLDL